MFELRSKENPLWEIPVLILLAPIFIVVAMPIFAVAALMDIYKELFHRD